jgi:hypothetical protein
MLATEVLLDKHQLQVGRETLRRWMIAEGLWLSRTQRRTFHQPRLRRESYGELLQIDGSDQQADATALLAEREHRLLFRGAERVSHDAWLTS